jgi:hypothetical protein
MDARPRGTLRSALESAAVALKTTPELGKCTMAEANKSIGWATGRPARVVLYAGWALIAADIFERSPDFRVNEGST